MIKKSEYVAPVLILAFAMLCYAAIIPTYFLSDDFSIISRIVKHGMFFNTPIFIRPIVNLSFFIDHAIYGLTPSGYHVTNIILHALTGYTVFLISRVLAQAISVRLSNTACILAAALFIALPNHSESVTWISGRSDLIATIIGLVGTLYFIKLFAKPSLFICVIPVLCFMAALLAKESLIVLPAIWITILCGYQLHTKERSMLHAGFVIIISIAWIPLYLFIRKSLLGSFVGGYGADAHLAFLHTQTLINFGHYVLRTFLPALPVIFDDQLFLISTIGLMISLTISLIAIACKKTGEISWLFISMITICYLLSLIPVLTMEVSLFDTMGERFLYFPSVFACIFFVYMVVLTIPNPRKHISLLVILIAVEASLLQDVNKRWIVASHIAEQVAFEVSKTKPEETIILSVPDNFQGAYIFRVGLNQAATLFLNNPQKHGYRTISKFNMQSLQQVNHVSTVGSVLYLQVEDGFNFEEPESHGFAVNKHGNTLTLQNVNQSLSRKTSFLYFKTGETNPMLRSVE